MPKRLPVVEDVRECGGCTLCCTLLAVEAIGKDEQTRCDHECEQGCAIYSTRPEPCKAFRCYWHLGILPIELRPDKVGAFVSQFHGRVLAVWERESGAAIKGDLQPWLRKRVRQEPVYVRSPDGWYKLEVKQQ